MATPVVTLLTDFGTRDAYVGIMKGVILGLCAEARIVDVTHEIPAHQVTAGALVLRSAAPFFPPGTIHVAVVDPGVGTARAGVLVQAHGGCFIGPDNGLLFPAAAAMGIERVVEIRNPAYGMPRVSATFHGRDIFAPAAGHLAAGASVASFGMDRSLQPLDLPVPFHTEAAIMGEVIHVDHFGNLTTNISKEDLRGFPGSSLSVSIARCARIPFVLAYADVAPGALAALIGSWDCVEIACRGGSAAATTAAGVGAAVTVRAR